MNKVVCACSLSLLPFVVNADMCVTVDDNLNIIEYECGTSPVVAQKTDYATDENLMVVESGPVVVQETDYETDESLMLVESVPVVVKNVNSENVMYVRAGTSVALDSEMFVGLGKRVFYNDKMFYDGEFLVSKSEDFADKYVRDYGLEHEEGYGMIVNGKLGYRLLDSVALYGGLGLGFGSLDNRLFISTRLAMGVEFDIIKRLAVFAEYAYATQFDTYGNFEDNYTMSSISAGVKYSF